MPELGSMTKTLRRAIVASGMAHIAIERETGVKRASIARFIAGERSLRLDKADALAAFFGLALRPDANAKRRKE